MFDKSILKSVLLAIALGGLALGSTSIMSVSPAQAQTQTSEAKQIVDDAKSRAIIGETIAGYLAIIESDASAEIINAMNEINIRRKSVYTKLARDQGVQTEVVAALTGEKLVANAKPGEKTLNADGNWIAIY